ncbi:ankyrin repeat-containing protein At5g02620-like [Vitis riparia]|uniref:ankyrin repeat-containing protein At5g02620-like n=1 Tax=Vitis riparia TaxID=96939 RepID=UPI00155AFEFE|nr:ankyrin repeat-containing protein At5g02620-like [Vitis riparia]
MADSTTSKLNLSTESIQVAAKDAQEVQITNQAAAEDGCLTKITFMDPKLYVAAADGHIHVLEQYDEIHVQLTPKKNTVLHVAAQFGQADCVQWILQLPSPSSLLQQPNEKGDTPLHLAAREGHLTVVKNLINAAKQLQEGDSERGGTAVCKVMLRMTNEDQDTALHEAVRYHHPEVVKLLIQEDPDFTYGANTQATLLFTSLAECGFGDLVQMILDNALHQLIVASKRSSERYVVYLGVKDHGNRTALHIAASRGHVDVVKVLVSHFPDCCEKVDDEGNNVLHLIMPEIKIFVTSGLSNIRWLRVRGLMNEKNVEGKTPLHLFHTSPLSKDDNNIIPPETIFTWILDTLVRLGIRERSSRVRMRPLGSPEIKEDSGSSERKESEEISEIKRTIKSHMIVAALIATVTFAAGFTLPGGYIQNESNNQGMAVLSLPTNGTKGKDRDMAIAVRDSFKSFVIQDSIAMVLSICAIGMFSIASFPTKNKKTVLAYLLFGNFLTMIAMVAMVFAFVDGLAAVLHRSSLLEVITGYILPVFILLLFSILVVHAWAPPRWLILYIWQKLRLVQQCKSF